MSRKRFLRSDCRHHLAGALSPFPSRSPCVLFALLACRVVLLYFLFSLRSDSADSSTSRIASGNCSGAGGGLDSVPGGGGALLGRLGAANRVSLSDDRLDPGGDLLCRAARPAAVSFSSLGNRHIRSAAVFACRLDHLGAGHSAPQFRVPAPCADYPARRTHLDV